MNGTVSNGSPVGSKDGAITMASAALMPIFTRTGTACELNGGATAIHAPARTRAKKKPTSSAGSMSRATACRSGQQVGDEVEEHVGERDGLAHHPRAADEQHGGRADELGDEGQRRF